MKYIKFSNPIFVVIISAVFILAILFGLSVDYMNEQHITAKVLKTEHISEFSGSEDNLKVDNYYLVFTDKGTFKITDQLFFGKFDSSDLYGKLELGKTYTFEVYGFRIPILSMYQNIKKYE